MSEKKKIPTTIGKALTKRFAEVDQVTGDLQAAKVSAQESGEDYSAKVHKSGSSEDTLKAANEMIAKDKAYLDSDTEEHEWDATKKSFVSKKVTGYFKRYGKPHPKKGY